jgi:2-polyprenyl-3-methyl-5-hydroxy-6-metoxy-1,4-benzoquinol methylase
MNKENQFIFIIFPNFLLGNHLNQILQFQKNRINQTRSNFTYILNSENNYDFDQELLKISCKSIDELKIKQDQVICFSESTSPMLDVKRINKIKIENDDIIEIQGGIPGTAPLFITKFKNIKSKIKNKKTILKIKPNKILYWDTQRFNNNQFDLNRSFRLKIFLKLLKKIPNMEKISIEEFLKKLDSEKIYNYILDYTVDKIRTKQVKICPHCNHTNLKSLYLTTNQPMIGFLSNKKPLYLECQNCGLVVLRKQCLMKDIHLLYDEFERPKINEEKTIEDYLNNKGESHFREKIVSLELLEKYAPKKSSMVDLGGGFGEFVSMAKHRNPQWNIQCIDFNLEHVKKILEKKNIIVHNKNFLEENIGKNYDVVTSLHVIEHIPVEGLTKYFKNIHKALNKNGLLLLTTPNYESPLGRIFDYHMMYPPQHQSILSVKWIERFTKELKLFKKITDTSVSVILENYERWFSYYDKTVPNEETRGIVKILDTIYNNKKMFKEFQQNINKNNLGSESIILFRKI